MILSKYVDNGNFGFIDRAGAFIALAGVMMIVQPENLFQPGETLPLGSGPETYTKLKGLGFGVVGIIGTVVSKHVKICVILLLSKLVAKSRFTNRPL